MSVSTIQGCVIIVPSLNKDEASEELIKMLNDKLAHSPEKIFFDCSLLESVRSNNIFVLWKMIHQCIEMGIPAGLISVGAVLARVLRVLDLYDFMVIEGEKPKRVLSTEKPKNIYSKSTTLNLKFQPTIDDINQALKQFNEYVNMQYLSEVACLELETVFYEVATNIRLHSNISEVDYIQFKVDYYEDAIVLCFEDSGQPFDITKVTTEFDAKESIRNKQKRGFGLIMIKRMVDSIQYKRKKDANILCLTKLISIGEN